MNDPAGPAINFMRHVRNANKFFIYPKAPANQTLVGEYSQTPPDYDGTTAVALLPDAYFPVVVDATVFIAESVDNEHVNSQRAQLFQNRLPKLLVLLHKAELLLIQSEVDLTRRMLPNAYIYKQNIPRHR